jgi:hypothetical protein
MEFLIYIKLLLLVSKKPKLDKGLQNSLPA